MEVFGFIWDFLFGTIIRSYHYITSWYANATEYGFVISTGAVIQAFLWGIVFCGSAFTAMTFAELKNRNRYMHFGLGFICPVVYPALLYFLLPTIGVAKKKKEDEQEGSEDEPLKNALPKSDIRAFNKMDDGMENLPLPEELDKHYFSAIAKDEHGNMRGPFILELNDGQILEIQAIVEALDPAVAVQIGTDEDARKIRLPYPKIKGCKTKEQWLADAEAEANQGYDAQEGAE